MDNSSVQNVIQGLATLTLLADILIPAFVIGILITRLAPKNQTIISIKNFLVQNGTALALIIASVATLGSLFLSEIAKFTPCVLCWYQRIFMYPLPILLGISLLINDKTVKKYVVPLATIGLAIAIYHYNLQLFPEILPCTDEAVSCARKQTMHFGYITIPFMSASAFLLILLLNIFPFLTRKKNK